jgi:hypothetical protein
MRVNDRGAFFVLMGFYSSTTTIAFSNAAPMLAPTSLLLVALTIFVGGHLLNVYSLAKLAEYPRNLFVIDVVQLMLVAYMFALLSRPTMGTLPWSMGAAFLQSYAAVEDTSASRLVRSATAIEWAATCQMALAVVWSLWCHVALKELAMHGNVASDRRSATLPKGVEAAPTVWVGAAMLLLVGLVFRKLAAIAADDQDIWRIIWWAGVVTILGALLYVSLASPVGRNAVAARAGGDTSE